MNNRTCIVNRQQCLADDMIRFVAAPDGSVVADLKRTLPGRGVWVCARRSIVDEAVRKNLFGRGLKRKVNVSTSLGAEIETLLEQAALAGLGLARKAGQCVTGSAKVSGAMRAGKVIALIHAGDAAEDGVKKLAGAARVLGKNGRQIKVLQLFDSGKLSMALGGENVVHAAATVGGAAKSFVKRAEALVWYREDLSKTDGSMREAGGSFLEEVNQV